MFHPPHHRHSSPMFLLPLLLLFSHCYFTESLDSRCASESTILIMYDTHNNHTFELAQAISKGIRSGGLKVDMFSVSNSSAPTSYSDVTKYHGLAIGSPVYFANPSAPVLQWIQTNLGPGWEKRTFANLPGAV